jgi:phage terminase large subunit
VIHPRCIHTAEEARLYSYKKDRLTNDILPEIVDANNHCIDAIRYALNPLIRQSTQTTGMIGWMQHISENQPKQEVTAGWH